MNERIKKDNIILPSLERLARDEVYGKCAIFIHLHYINDVDCYIPYIYNIPIWIDVYISYDDIKLKKVLEKKIIRKNITFVSKQNRGRDISALLVAFREYILEYEYICFLHDKKEKSQLQREDTEAWIRCLWENMIGSEAYIENVIFTLKSKETIGLLTPPNILEKRTCYFYKKMWGDNLYNTQILADELGLSIKPIENDSTITLGTVFWAKTSALKKMLIKEWKYEDFISEPLPDDGTLSHAIERIFPYVVIDAGYEIGWVMHQEYASVYIENISEVLSQSMGMLEEYMGIRYIYEMDKYEAEKKKIQRFIENKANIYIYGAGAYGISCLKLLNSIGVIPECFIVTEKNNTLNTEKLINNIPIKVLDDIKFCGEDGIIVAMNTNFRKQVIDILRNKNIDYNNIIFFSRIEFL